MHRIALLYLAHRDLATTEPGTEGHRHASQAFNQALADIDTARHAQAAGPGLHPAARKVLATLDREWDGLVRHRDFPDIALDNNTAERGLGTPVIGRKNYYGANAQWAAHLAARVWTITATAERNHREPLTFLTDYLNACAEAGSTPPDAQTLERFFAWLPVPDNNADSRDTTRPQTPAEILDIPTYEITEHLQWPEGTLIESGTAQRAGGQSRTSP